MTEQRYFLKEEVYFEPLIHNWYAWPYMIPPIQSAMIFSKRLIKIMKSFVANHKLHVAASKNKKLAGGSFLNCTEDQVDVVKALVDNIETNCQDYFEVRDALTELNDYLENNAQGFSLENEYYRVPEVIKGYVELVYNENNNGFYRLIEGLIYLSPLYKPQAQSISLGLMSRVDERPFVLGTPRLADDNHLQIDIQFEDKLIDELAKLREIPKTKAQIAAMFADCQFSGGLTIDDLLTTDSPKTSFEPKSDQLNIKFLGHAGLFIEADGVNILIDPVIPSRTQQQSEDFFSFSDLPESIDFICVTHTHMDHVCLETLLQLRYKTNTILVPKNNGGTITDPSLKLMLKRLGFNVTEMEDMEMLSLKNVNIRAIPFLGEHADLNIRSKTAWLVEAKGKKILAAADSSNLEAKMYQNIHAVINDIDLLYIGMECVGAPMSWLYGSFFTKPIPREMDQSRRFNGSAYTTAKTLVDIFNPKEVYIYALALEPHFNYFMGLNYSEDSEQIVESDKLLAYCGERQIPCARLEGSRQWSF